MMMGTSWSGLEQLPFDAHIDTRFPDFGIKDERRMRKF